MLPRTTLLAAILAAAVLAPGCTRTAEVTWPGTDVVRYEGRVERIDGRLRAHGEWRFWYPDGVQQAEGDFRDAPLPGPEDLEPERTRIPREGRALWWSFWDREGRMTAEGQYDAQGRRSRLWVCWFENGRQCCTGHFREGEPHGYHVTWYPDGAKREERTYQHGLLDGRRTVWSEDGVPVWTGDYEAGELVAANPSGVPEPPIHEVEPCAERGERGEPRSPAVARN